MAQATVDQAVVERTMIELIREIQLATGRSFTGMDSGTKPIGGVEGFDSLNAVEVGAMLAERLGVSVGDNPLMDKRGQPLTVGQAAAEIVAANGGGNK